MNPPHKCLILAALICCANLPAEILGDPQVTSFPLSSFTKDNLPRFNFDETKPFRLEFGRGSGWHGLNTIAISESGHVVLHRLKEEEKAGSFLLFWETTTFPLESESIEEIASLIRDSEVAQMHRKYYAEVADGTQWILWLQQGSQSKSIYFNNHFPEQIQRFAIRLDMILDISKMDKLVWSRVPKEQSRRHEKEIWNSIKNKPNNQP